MSLILLQSLLFCDILAYTVYNATKKIGVNFHSVCHWRHSLGSDISDYFFWSEYRVNRTRFHSLSSEFSLYWS